MQSMVFSFSCKIWVCGRWKMELCIGQKRECFWKVQSQYFLIFMFLQGVAEYLKIEEVRTPENMELLKTCYETMEKNVFDPWF